MAGQPFYLADPHFGHTAILEHCNRPFDSIEEHDQHIIDIINRSVLTQDQLYIVGDFSLNAHEQFIRSVLGRISCRNVHLIRGNHDTAKTQTYYLAGFKTVTDTDGEGKLIRYQGKKVYASHYAHHTWPKQRSGAVHVFGHSHGRLILDRMPAFDCGWDIWGRPLSHEEVHRLAGKAARSSGRLPV